MMTEEPTTLYIPPSPADGAGAVPVSAWVGMGMAGLPVLVGVAWLIVLLRRRQRVRPEEHAFRALARRMRLPRHQIEAVRRWAQQARREPIDVLMNESLLEEALSGS